MKYHFTKHALQKFTRMKAAGFPLTQAFVKRTIEKPRRIEEKSDNTSIATTLLSEHLVIRVVYRREDDIIVVITFYPGRRKAYEI